MVRHVEDAEVVPALLKSSVDRSYDVSVNRFDRLDFGHNIG